MKVIDMITDAVSPLNINEVEYDLMSSTHFSLTYRLEDGRFSIEYKNGMYEIDSYINQRIGRKNTQDYEMFKKLAEARKEVERIFREVVVNFDYGEDILFKEVEYSEPKYSH